jgi:hypothetical protein
MSIYGVLFVFMSLMKSLPMVARTEMLRRNTPGDWSVKDRTSCTENLHLGHEDDIVKIMQVEGAKCINAWGPTGAKGRPNRVEVGLGRSAHVDRPSPLPASVRPPLPCTRRIFNPKALEAPPFAEGRAIHTRRPSTSYRERREISGGGLTTSKEAPTSGEEGRHRRKGDHDQRCYV